MPLQLPLRLPTRFSLKAMLLLTAAVALVAFLTRDHYRVLAARERHDHVRASWLAHRVTLEDFVVSSEELARAEANSPWTFRRTAESRHVERMSEPIKYYESGVTELMPDIRERRLEYLRENIREHLR